MLKFSLGVFGCAILFFVLLLISSAHARDFRAGVEAYERGDFEAALREWRPLAEKGDAVAQAGLGILYSRGQSVPQDFVEALKWTQLSVEQGHPFGQKNLADAYRHGNGVPQDYKTAVLYYWLSAAQGYAPAQYNLGYMYDNGLGVRQDLKNAYMWYSLAAEQGHKNADQSRVVLDTLLSDDDRREAVRRARMRQKRIVASSFERKLDAAGAAERHNANVSMPKPSVEKTSIEEETAAWRIQLIALKREDQAERVWKELRDANPRLLANLSLFVQKAELPKGTFYRVQAGPLPNRTVAADLCQSLKAIKQDCLVVSP